LNRLDARYTMAVRCGTKGIADAISAIDETAWTEIDYTPDGQAQVADCAYTTGKGKHQITRRLVVRRTRLTGRAQQRLWPDWRHHALLTDLDGTPGEIDKFHRHHAVVELTIRDLKEGAGLAHVPSGKFHANSVWLQCAVLAHNLIRWTAICGKVRVDEQLIVARTVRTQLLTIPGRIMNRAGRPTLRLPTNWPWAKSFTTALDTLRTLQPASG
jgi:Transposase DDE domain group 1